MTEPVVPMSPSQQGMYFDCQLSEATDYHVVLHLRIEPLRREQVVEALRRTMEEQPALRSSARNSRSGPSYVVAESVEEPYEFHEVQGREHALDGIETSVTQTPFQLDQGPLFRVAHCRLGYEDRLIIVAHHLIADGQSVSCLAEQLLSTARENHEIGQQPPRIDEGFNSYQLKQKAVLPAKKEARQRAFWEENLSKHDDLDLSHWMRRPAEESTGREYRLPLQSSFRDELRSCAQEVEISENSLYLGAFGLLLARYAGSDQVSVAVPFADRPGLETEQSIGCFIKTLPVRVDCGPEQTVRSMLKQVSGEILGTWKHLGYPVTSLLADHPAVNSIYDVTFIQDSYPALPEGVLGIERPDRVHFPGTFTVLVEQIADNCELVFQYDDSALSEEKVSRFAQRYVALLTQLPHVLEAPVADLQSTPTSEMTRLRSTLSQTHYFDWEPSHLGTTFLAKTTHEPARIAWSDAERTYSNAWVHDAAVLVQRRVLDASHQGPQPVAILLPRSAQLLASLFGTMLAGNAYVPLSEDMPATRITQILEDASISVVLTMSTFDMELPAGITRLNLDEWDEFKALLRDQRTQVAEQPTVVDVHAQDVLYIEYTSGSTGQPKGVVVRHANIQNTAMDLERRFPLRPDDTFLLKTAFTFDIFGTELYGWLFGQGRLDILPPGHEGDPLAVLSAIRDRGITHVNFSPTMLRVFLEAVASTSSPRDLDSLRFVFSGGEALTADIMDRFFALNLRASLENVYGPTEATMWATHCTISDHATDGIAPIGTPLNDYRIYILNRFGSLCGVDIPGEICIAGAGVTAGYLNRQELNASQFIENPFYDPAIDPDHMRRMYRTGDLGFLREDGQFAFIRRIDRQVKVGGVRIELGEIEQALLHVEGVVEAAVVIDDRNATDRLAGFFTANTDIPVANIRTALAHNVMPHLIPASLQQIDSLPRSAAGKLDHRALKEQLGSLSHTPVASTIPESELHERILALWQRVLGTDHLSVDGSFFEQGGNSLSLMSLQLELQEEFNREIAITELLKHHSIAAQARLFENDTRSVAQTRRRAQTGEDVAIIGIGIQVPGATDVHEFWANLQRGDESIKFYDDDELRDLGVEDSDLRDPNYVKAKGKVDDINFFDDNLFSIPPAEIDASSPQLRLLYKTFWQACENAGYDPVAMPGRVGVFAGGNDDFAWYQRALMGANAFGDLYQNFTLATNHFLSTRLSYLFDLTGPSMSSLTGCSTSLLTVHQAAQSLRAGECDMAVAGGVTIELPNEGGYRYVDGMMLSPDGHCRPFDSEAAGTVFSNGAALLVLKTVSDALADNDPIYAVIKGSAVGNDGGNKPSFTAPSEDGQYETIRAAYEVSGIDPASVTYVEAHGTGTQLGDPIEVASLSRVFEGSPIGECTLSSVKGNVGHTDSAAGAVGLSKVALSLKHRYQPGTRNFGDLNPNINLEGSPFTISGDGKVWRGEKLRAGINSFGVGGTNVHMIVEESPHREPTEDHPWELLQFSAASEEALDRTAQRVVRYLADNDDVSLSDAALTLRHGRGELPYRTSMSVSTEEVRDAELWVKRLASMRTKTASGTARVALMFSGQGNQYHSMGRGLYESHSPAGAIYRYWMDELISYLPSAEAVTFRDVLFGDDDDGRINRTEWSQFALFSTQFSLVKVIESFGIKPDVLVGHSIGELTAAALANVWSLRDAAWLVRERGKLMQAQPPGIMVAVAASAQRAQRAIDGMTDVWVSLDNSAERSVLGMTTDTFGDVVDRLEDEGIRGSKLHTSHAFHTPLMADSGQKFASALSSVESRDPSIPIISNRSGRVVSPGEMTEPAYWSEHIVEAVNFTDGVRTLLSDGPLFAIELGPGSTLTTFAAQDPQIRPDHVFVNMLRHPAESATDVAYLLNSLGQLWSGGLPLDWSHHDRGHKISLPGYVFDQIPHQQDFGVLPEPEAPAEKPVVNVSVTDAVSALQDAFKHVLGYPEVAEDDDFFALGGDSLKATGLVAYLESHAGIVLTVANIFSTPTPAGLAEHFGQTDAAPGIRKAAVQEDYPLSPAQTRMYIAATMDPGQLIYNMPSATLLKGTVDPEKLRIALERLIDRHEVLRTTFVMREGDVRQKVADSRSGSTIPLRFSQGNHAEEGALARIMAEFVQPFDIANGPLFRMEIVDGGEAGSLLLFDIHHIISDAIAVEVLTRDLSDLYDRDLEPLELQYIDYVMHLQEPEYQEVIAESTDYLAAALQGAPTGDLLPTDHPRGQRDHKAGRVALHLDSQQVDKVKTLAESHNATPFMVMLSAWGAVLSRYADSDELMIGAPVTGRTMAQTREMNGMFVNMMPIRLQTNPTTSFGQYLDESRESVLDALTHQDVPFDQLVEKLNWPRVPGRHPLFDISFDYHNMEHHDLQIAGVTAEPLELEPLAVGMDLVITCVEGDNSDGMTIHLDYAADLFDTATIEQIGRCFEVLLRHGCEDDATPLAQIPLYSDGDYEAIRERVTGAPFSPLHQLIAERAEETPEKTAVIDADGQHYTYAHIDGLANAHAARLQRAGLEPGAPVALFAVRDVNLLIAQLSILKAGGAYVPVDSTQPTARQKRIIAEARPRIAFAPNGLEATEHIDTVIDINTCVTATPSEFETPVVGPDDPIYLMFTSGSTGEPKGIAVRHRGVFNLFRDHQQREIFGPGDVIISLADPTFDIFTFESLFPLASGASVHMCPADERKDAVTIAARIAAHGVTHIQAPVSKMSALCDNRRFKEQLPALRTIVCGGEHFAENLLTQLHNETSARIFNMYGPTETTVTTTVKEFSPGDAVTIGSAVSGSDVLVVNEHGIIQPDGVPGELYVAGEGLALGYLNNSEETHRAFTTLAELPDVPVYRTGDVGTRRADGDIVLKGRIDHQVKVNGNRIELGEIEKTAMQADGVSYAVALVEDGDLVLYYTSTDASDLSASITTEIAAVLPSYMKPERIEHVLEMPKLSNLKIDRKALRGLSQSTHVEPTPLEAPPTPVATDILGTILTTWEKVLGHPARPGDNFFDIGGNSYKLMLVNNQISEKLDTDIPLLTLFENPTPRSLAATLGEPTSPTSQDDHNAITMDDLSGFDTWNEPQEQHSEGTSDNQKIAVVGIAGQFPGAATVPEHWDNRRDGIVSISRFTREELREAGIDDSVAGHPNYVNARGYVDASTFDADFFQYSARDAETMDPQLRLLHQTTWHALEDGGYVPDQYAGDIALFVGSGTNFAWMAKFLSRQDDPMGIFEAMTMNEKDFLATKIAYKLNLTGPAVNVQTACSTSLVAIHKAVQSLRQGESDMALAGGVALNFPRKEGYPWHDGMIFSKDGECRPFSQDADGTVGGQGCGVVLLKPLDAAIADGDHIYGVIAGTAINNDGNNKIGYSAPSAGGQEQVIRAALADAGTDAADVGYVETHGTGTKLGDPIEYAALSTVYGKQAPCALGAVKANIGHLDAAAGVAGFIGALGVLHRQQIPPLANFQTLNEDIEHDGALYIPTAKNSASHATRAAAVSSFGIGGTNAHLVLETAPPRDEQPDRDEATEYVYPVSAQTEDSRRRMQRALEEVSHTGLSRRDISYTLAQGRAEFESRAAGLATPGKTLSWMEPADPPLAIDVSDDEQLTFANEILRDHTSLGTTIRETIERELRVFDEGLRDELRKALYEGPSFNTAIDRITQFVVRVALIRIVGAPGLYSVGNANRLLRIATAFVAGDINPGQVMRFLKSGQVPGNTVPEQTREPSLVEGPLDLRLLQRVLVSRWVNHGSVDKSQFAQSGHRVPLPGYAFSQQRFVSDIRLDELRSGSNSSEPTPADDDAEKSLRQAWAEVLGTDPAEDDDFLQSGGDSMAAVHLCALIQDRTGATVTVGDFFADARFAAIRDLVLQQSETKERPQPDLVPSPPAAPLTSPASPAQRRMYAVCALQDDTTAYNLAAAYRVTGTLDVDHLRTIFGQLVERHEQLRTSFHLENGELVQRVHPQPGDVVSLTEVTSQEAEARIAEGPRPFDLSTSPLIRVDVLSVDGQPRYLLIDMHHIVGDQSSLAILGDDIATALQGKPLPVVPMRYTEYVDQLAAMEAAGEFDADVAFFATMLSGDTPTLELPTDNTPSKPATFDGARRTFVSSASRQAIADLARQCGATPYMVFLTALTRLLSLYSGQREFVLGTAVSGRSVPGTERTVGMFVNSLPLRVTDASQLSVTDAIEATKENVLAVLRHQNAPFEAVLAQLDLPLDGDSNPLFDVVFNYVNMGTEELDLGEVRLDPVPPGQIKSKYAISINVAEHASDFSIDFEYRTEMFDDQTITRMAGQLDQLLVALTTDPHSSIARLPLESDEERRRRRAILNGGGPSIEESLLDRIRQSFATHAHRPAFRWEGHEWTYQEIDQITDALAGGLQGVGVGEGDFVLCLLERDSWQVFTRLALMKCGAVEIPLDPSAPAERIDMTIKDSGARVVLGSNPQQRVWPGGVTAFRPQQLSGAYHRPATITADSPLTMIYTSGTTGQPKGTLVTSGGMLSACADNGYTDYAPGDRILHLTSYTFDGSLLDIHTGFLSGATVVMGRHEYNMDMKLLSDFLLQERIDKGLMITAVFHLLMTENPEAVKEMSALYVGGEAMQQWAAQRAWNVMGPGKLYNLYGPTEVSVVSTFYRINESPDYARIPIGGPAQNRELYIVHPDGTDVPQGIPGELCVAGAGLAAGYHQRPELTAEKFVDSGGSHTSRVYRTGDRVFLDSSDRLVYIDRIDRQIKHAGYRIELSEIELTIQNRTGVNEAIIIHSKNRDDSRLTAFYTGESAPAEAELRNTLLATLPHYMVPQQLIWMRELPLTSHGKVDRKLLASKIVPTEAPPAPAPTGQSDSTILAAFREVLGEPTLTATDDFFQAGAQSLQAIALVRTLRESGIELNVTDVYRYPSAKELSSLLRPAAAPAVTPTPPQPRRELSAQKLQRMIGWAVDDGKRVADAFTDHEAAYSFPLGAIGRLHLASGADKGGFIQSVTGVEIADLKEALGELVTRHEVLRSRLNGDRIEVLDPRDLEDLSTLMRDQDLRRVEDTQIGEFINSLAQELQAEPFHDGLLWRCVILRESAEKIRLVWAFHHSIFDGFSAGIVKDELSRLLRGDNLPEAQRYSEFLTNVDSEPDWQTELDSFAYLDWLAANRAMTDAIGRDGAPQKRRWNVPLGDKNPLDVALNIVYGQLGEISGTSRVAIGFVTDCRRWKDHDYSRCAGEFLDVTPILLQGDNDQARVTERLERAPEKGLHYVHALSTWSGHDERLTELQSVYQIGRGYLDLTLVNFQGYLPPEDVPTSEPGGPSLATAHINLWYDDEFVHLEWVTD